MDPVLSAILGGLWLVIGGVAVVLMLRVFGRPIPTSGRTRIVRIHRALGWVYTLIYAVMLVVMIRKVLAYGEFTALQALHLTLGISILPLLGAKILIVRRYPKLHKLLPSLGLTVFSISFVLIVIGMGPLLIAKATAPDTAGKSDEELVALGAQLLEQRCQKCHDLDRVYDQKGKKSPELWASTVDRMVELEPPLADVREPVLLYLQQELAAPDTPEGEMLTGAALVEARCTKCHNLDRVFGPTKTEDLWRSTVQRYARLLPDHIRADEVEPIVAFLFEKRGAPPDPLAAKRKVFEQHCGSCHNLSRALEVARENELSPRRWRRTIKRMKGVAEEREVAVWTDEERDIVAEYLSAQYVEITEESD